MAVLSRSAPNGLQKKHLYKYIQIFGIHKVYDTSREYKCQNSNNIAKTKHNITKKKKKGGNSLESSP